MRLKAFLGRAECGCVQAAMVDDENTSAKDVAEFARDVGKWGGKIEHIEYTPADRKVMLDICKCGDKQETLDL